MLHLCKAACVALSSIAVSDTTGAVAMQLRRGVQPGALPEAQEPEPRWPREGIACVRSMQPSAVGANGTAQGQPSSGGPSAIRRYAAAYGRNLWRVSEQDVSIVGLLSSSVIEGHCCQHSPVKLLDHRHVSYSSMSIVNANIGAVGNGSRLPARRRLQLRAADHSDSVRWSPSPEAPEPAAQQPGGQPPLHPGATGPHPGAATAAVAGPAAATAAQPSTAKPACGSHSQQQLGAPADPHQRADEKVALPQPLAQGVAWPAGQPPARKFGSMAQLMGTSDVRLVHQHPVLCHPRLRLSCSAAAGREVWQHHPAHETQDVFAHCQKQVSYAFQVEL